MPEQITNFIYPHIRYIRKPRSLAYVKPCRYSRVPDTVRVHWCWSRWLPAHHHYNPSYSMFYTDSKETPSQESYQSHEQSKHSPYSAVRNACPV